MRHLGLVLSVSLLLSLTRCKHVTPTAPRAIEVTPATYTTSDAKYPSDNGYYRVENYGAKGDGVADDTKAIQKAMDAAMRGPINGGRYGTVYFKKGTYLISDTLMWARFGNPEAQVSSTVDPSRGCITSLRVVSAGSGYGSKSPLYFSGGGGYGPSVSTGSNGSGGISSAWKSELGNTGPMNCLGLGYKSPPQIRVLNAWKAYLRFEGESKASTIIRLSDSNAKFQNTNCKVSPYGDPEKIEPCKAMLYTANESAGNSSGIGESGYINDIWNLTISTGTGNPGAIALDWQDSNRASAKNLIIKSEDGKAKCGLSVARSTSAGTGPGYAKNILIQGFEYGIYAVAGAHEVGTTFEFIDLVGMTRAGVVNGGMPNWFRKITSVKTVAPVFVNKGDGGSILVVDGAFDGTGGGGGGTEPPIEPPIEPPVCPCAPQFRGAEAIAAIQNQGTHGVLYLRNIKTGGYASAVGGVSGAEIDEYAYPQAMTNQRKSLNLGPVPNTPEHWRYPDEHPEDFTNVAKFGSACAPFSNQNASDCIQAALNATKDICYLPFGKYKINKTLHVPGNVRVFYGDSAFLTNSPPKAFCTISVEGDANANIEIRNINFDQSTQSNSVCVSSQGQVTLADSLGGISLTVNTTGSTKPIFIENFAIPVATFNLGPSQPVWARQWDVESGTGQHTYQTGGIFWMFGYKTEGAGALWKTTNGTLELLGSFSSTAGGPSAYPAYQFNNSKGSAHGMTLKANGWRTIMSDDGTNVAPNRVWVGSGHGTGAFRSKRAQ